MQLPVSFSERIVRKVVRIDLATFRWSQVSILMGFWTAALALIILLPIVYLAIRAIGADSQVWGLVIRISTLMTLFRTALLAIAVTAASICLALPLAWLTVRTDLPLRRFWTVATVLPLVIPSYVGAYLFVASFGPRGMISQGLINLGLPPLPSIFGFPGAWIILTLFSFPYLLLSIRAALQGLDPALDESARSLGYGPWRTFFKMTLPQLHPALAAGSLLVSLYVLRDFGAVSILRYDTFTRVIYTQYQSSFDRTSAAVLSLILICMTLVILWFDRWSRNRLRYDYNIQGGRRVPALIKLGVWRIPALVFCGAVVFLGLVTPAGVLFYWLVRGIQVGEQLTGVWMAARNSLLVSFLAAAITVIAAIPFVVLNVRYPNRWSFLLERLTYIGYALPGIVIALALVFFGTRFAISMYQTIPMLLLAYLILFLPQAIGVLRASLLQVSPILEEAARSLGRHPVNVFRTITLPLVKPGVLAGASLVFMTTMKELPATLILSPIGFKTLAMSIWMDVSEAYFARAAVPALILILISSLSISFLLSKENR
jgi:iron(III) transport system permease protein